VHALLQGIQRHGDNTSLQTSDNILYTDTLTASLLSAYSDMSYYDFTVTIMRNVLEVGNAQKYKKIYSS